MTESNKFILYSVFHKPFIVPNSNIVQPIHAGKAIAKNDLGFMGDNEGENISALNPLFCELTVLYAIWKNKLYKDCILKMQNLSNYNMIFMVIVQASLPKKIKSHQRNRKRLHRSKNLTAYLLIVIELICLDLKILTLVLALIFLLR